MSSQILYTREWIQFCFVSLFGANFFVWWFKIRPASSNKNKGVWKRHGQSFLLPRKTLGAGTVHKNRHGGPFKTETPLWLKIISVLSDSKGHDTHVQVSNSDQPNFTYFIVFASISIKKIKNTLVELRRLDHLKL